MAQLHGKQLKDTSLSLNKLSGTGIATFSSATMSFDSTSRLQINYTISNGIDVVNKDYVDAVASGLDAKVPVTVVAATGSITLSGDNFMIDGFTVSSGDRVLVAAQAGPNVATASNGIYVVSTGAWSRATDSDGTPANEVSHGNFVFVLEGAIYEHTGWVLTITDAVNPDQIVVGTDSQGWVQFSEQANIRAGAGLSYNGQTLNVGQGTGITVGVDDISITNTTVTAGNYGTAGSVAQFTVNAQGQLTGATSVSIDINSGQINDFTVATENVVFQSANFTNGTTVDFTVVAGDSVSAEVTLNSLTASRLNIINPASASQDWKLGYNSSGQFEWFDPTAGDISAVVAGNGLTGGGVAGSVTLDLNVENGIDIVNDYVGLGGTMSRNTTINGNTYDIFLGNFDNIVFTASVFDVMTDGLISLDAGTGSVQISANDSILITSTQNDITLSPSTYLYISTSASQITTTNLKGLEYVTDYSATFVSNSLITKKYVDDAVAVINSDFITGVTAGSGLSGGGTSGFVTLDVNVNSDSLEIDGSDNVRLKDTITGNRTFQDTVTVGGNLIVNGTVSYINTENLYVEDNIITLNATWSGSPLLNAGIEVIRGASPSAALIWNETLDLWAAGLSGSESTIITEAGTGLSKSGNTLSINTSGFTSTLAGDGLVANGSAIDVVAGTGLTVSANDISIANTTVTAGNYGTAGSVAQFTVNAQGQLIGATSVSIDINSGQINDFNVATENVIFDSANFVDGATVDFTVTAGASVSAEVAISSLTASRLNIINPGSASQDWKLGYNSSGQFEWFDPTTGDISEVVAGSGLSGGGLSGVVTLDVNTGLGLTISSDSVQMVWGGTSSGLTFSNNGVSANVDGTTITINNSGQLSVVVAGSAQPVYYVHSLQMYTSTGSNGQVINALVHTPNPYSRIQIFVNGQLQRLGDGNTGQDCYYSSDGGSTAKSLNNLQIGDSLYWNAINAGFDLTFNVDEVLVVFEA